MAVAFDANSAADSVFTGAGPFNITAGNANNITIGSGSNRAVVFQVLIGNGTARTVSSVTWDQGASNQAATFIGRGTLAAGSSAELWGVIAPVAGNKALQVAISGTATDIFVTGVSYTGVNQTGGATSFTHFTSGSGTGGSTPTLAVTSATANAVVAGWVVTATNITSASGTTVYIDNTSGGLSSGAVNRAAGAASVTMSLAPGNDWVGAAVDIVASVASFFPPQGIVVFP